MRFFLVVHFFLVFSGLAKTQETFFYSFPQFENHIITRVLETQDQDFFVHAFSGVSTSSSWTVNNNIILGINQNGEILNTFDLSDVDSLSLGYDLEFLNDTLSIVGTKYGNNGEDIKGFYRLLLDKDLKLLDYTSLDVDLSNMVNEYIAPVDIDFLDGTFYFVANGYISFLNYIITANKTEVKLKIINDYPIISQILPVSDSTIHLLGSIYRILNADLETINEIPVRDKYGLRQDGRISLFEDCTVLSGKILTPEITWEPFYVSLDNNFELIDSTRLSYDDDHFSNFPTFYTNLTKDIDHNLLVGSTIDFNPGPFFNGNNPTTLIFAKYDKFLNQLCTNQLDFENYTFLLGTQANEFSTGFLAYGTQSKIGIDSHYPFLLRGNNMCELSSVQEKEIFIPEIVLYPNPTADRLYIDVADYEIGGVSIADVNGKEVINDYQNRSGNLDVSLLNSGTYFITVALKDGKTFTKSFVKM